MLEQQRRQEDGKQLPCCHNQREHERTELLDGYENKDLTDGTSHWQEEHMVHNFIMGLYESDSFRELALEHHAKERVQNWVEVCHEHHRHTGHWELLDQIVLPRAREAVTDQIAKETDQAW